MSPSSGETTWSGWTVALPPPCVRAVAAFGPTSATRRSSPRSSGSTPPSFLTSTVPAADASRRSAAVSSAPGGGGGDGTAGATPSSAPTRAARRSSRRTFSSIAASGTRPSRTASASGSPQNAFGPGIVRSSAARPAVVRRARRRPVRHHDAVEAPLALERLGEQRALRHRRPVDAVVGGHERPRRGEAPDVLERREVELAQRALVDARVDGHPVGLRLVGDVVLDRRGDAARLHAAHVRRADPAAQDRVLGEVLEVAAAERAAVEVHARREEDVDVLAAGLGGEQAAQALDEPLVPARRERRRRRQVRGGVALVPAHAADARRPVGEDHRPQPDLGLGERAPLAGAGEEPDLPVEVEAGERLLDALLDGRAVRVRGDGDG